MRYQASDRVIELSVPREYNEFIHNRPENRKISKKVLKFKASPRLIELAKPKERYNNNFKN